MLIADAGADFNIVKSTITSAAVDDRFRRLVVGTHTGEIRVYNLGSGAFMKKSLVFGGL